MIKHSTQVPKGVEWDELKVSEVLLQYRREQVDNKGASFTTIGNLYISLAFIITQTFFDYAM